MTHYFTGQTMRGLGLYEGRKPLNEYQKRLINSLSILKDTVKHGKLSISKITEALNADVPDAYRITPKKTGSILKGLGLETEESTGGIYYLVWNPEKIQKLFSETMSTNATKSTHKAEAEVSEVDKVDIVDFDLESDKVELIHEV